MLTRSRGSSRRKIQPPYRLIVAAIVIITLLSARSAMTATKSQAAINQTVVPDFAGLSEHYLSLLPDSTQPFIDAKEYILIDGTNGNILLDNDATVSAPIGSTTKMVTALVASQLFAPDKVITVSPSAAAINGSTVGFNTGEQITVKSLLQALLIPSGNDAAYALAEAYSGVDGDFQKFVDQMNLYATNHHLKQTHYLDPAGLDDNGTSTAFDLAQIGRLVMNDPTLSQIVSTANSTISSADSSTTYPLKNTDQLIQAGLSPYFNPNVIGVKTGFTPLAGYCLVAAEKFHGHLLIAVVLGVPGNGETASAKEIDKIFSWADDSVTVSSY